MAEEGSFSVLSTAGTSSDTGSEVTDRERDKVKIEDPEDGEMEEMDSSELVLSHQEAMSKVEAAIDEIVSVSWSVLTSYYANYQYNIGILQSVKFLLCTVSVPPVLAIL